MRASEAFWREVVKPGGVALALSGFALSLVPIFVINGWNVPGQWPVTIIVIAVVIIVWGRSALAGTIKQLSEAHVRIEELKIQSQPHTPKVVYATLNPAEENGLILLLQPNRLFGQSMLVSIYYEDERGFEQFVADGRVANIQTNGMIQVAIIKWEPAHEELKRHVASQDTTRLARLLVRPAPTTEAAFMAVENEQLNHLLSILIEKAATDARQF